MTAWRWIDRWLLERERLWWLSVPLLTVAVTLQNLNFFAYRRICGWQLSGAVSHPEHKQPEDRVLEMMEPR